MSTPEELRAKKTSLEVSKALGKERERLKMSKNELSQRSGISRTAIRLIEAGERQPTIYTAALLSLALGIKLSDLVRNSE